MAEEKKSRKPLIVGGVLLVVAALVALLGLRTVTEEAIEVATSGPDFVEPSFVNLGRMTFPIIRRNRVVSQFAVTITLEVVEDSQIVIVEDNDTRLRDAYRTELHRASVWRHAESGYALPLDLVKERLLAVSERVLGEDIVVEVLVSAVVERDLE